LPRPASNSVHTWQLEKRAIPETMSRI